MSLSSLTTGSAHIRGIPVIFSLPTTFPHNEITRAPSLGCPCLGRSGPLVSSISPGRPVSLGRAGGGVNAAGAERRLGGTAVRRERFW